MKGADEKRVRKGMRRQTGEREAIDAAAEKGSGAAGTAICITSDKISYVN